MNTSNDGPDRLSDNTTRSIDLRAYYRYTVEGPKFRPVGDVRLSENLPAGAYQIRQDIAGMYLEAVKPVTDALMTFSDSACQGVVEEIDKFWSREANFKDLGLMHNRGIIMHGPPGTGKSAALQQVVERMTKRGEIVLFAQDAGVIPLAVQAVRQIEEKRKIVVSFEEADELASYNERTLLRLLDGDMKIGGVCYLATTNYLERLSPRMLRPGRFDKLIYIAPPTLEHRLAYLTAKLKGKVTDAELAEMAKKTDGFGFGHLRELLAGVFAMGEPLDDVLLRLRDRRSVRESAGSPSLVESAIARLRVMVNTGKFPERKLLEYGIGWAPPGGLGSRGPKTHSAVVQELSALDKELASNDEFQDAANDALTSNNVDNWTDLEKADPTQAERLVGLGRRIKAKAGKTAPAECLQSAPRRVMQESVNRRLPRPITRKPAVSLIAEAALRAAQRSATSQ